MRACLLLLVFVLAPAAAQDKVPAARMLAARALLTAKAMADRPDQAVELARRVLQEFKSLDKNAVTPAARNVLLREVGRVLDIMALQLKAYDEDYLMACAECASLAKDPKWIARGLANSVLRDTEDAKAWIDSFEKCEKPDERLTRAADVIQKKPWWATAPKDVATADLRARLLVQLKAANPVLSQELAACIGKVATDVAGEALDGPESTARARLGVYSLNKLASAWPELGRQIERKLPKLRVVTFHGLVDGPVAPQTTPSAIRLGEYDIPADQAYLHARLEYVMKVPAGKGDVACIVSFPDGTNTLRIPAKLPADYAVVQGLLPDAGTKYWLMARAPWSEKKLADTFSVLLKDKLTGSNIKLGLDLCGCDLTDPDQIGETRDDKIVFKKAKSPEAMRGLTKLVKDFALPSEKLKAAIPAWARDHLGWRGDVLAATGALGEGPWVFHPVIEGDFLK